MRHRTLAAALLAGIVSLSACAAPAPTASNDRSYDVSGIEKVDSLADLLPQKIKDAKKIVVGTSPDYAPAEFRADDLKTAIGYDMDLAKALGRVLGVEVEISGAEFATLLPGIGSKYDIGISSFTIKEERTANYNMVSYITVGSSYATRKGNPDKFNPEDLCGTKIAVQTGTWQEEELTTFSETCTKDGKQAIEILKFGTQSDVTTNVAGGKAVAMYADSTVSAYAVKLTNGQLEVTGAVRDAAPQGIVVAKADAELTAAIQKATQKLMDDGTWDKILTSWGTQEAGLKTAEVNPTQ